MTGSPRSANTPRSRGPRGGDSDTRGDILAAARTVFADRGYTAASLRGIAREAGVDPALLHHYFDGKVDLYWQAVMAPLASRGMARPDPPTILAGILAGPREEVGRRWAAAFLRLWDAQDGPEHFRALVHGLTTSEEGLRTIREFLMQEVFHPLVHALGVDHPDLRAQLAATQLIGLGMGRYVGRLPELRDLPADALAVIVGDAIQHYLFDPLPPGLLPTPPPEA